MPASAFVVLPAHRHARAEELLELRPAPRRLSMEVAAAAAESQLLRQPTDAESIARIGENTIRAEEALAMAALIDDADNDDSDGEAEAVPDLSGTRAVTRRDQINTGRWLTPGDGARDIYNDYALGVIATVGG